MLLLLIGEGLVGVVTGQGAVGERGQVFQKGWERDGVVWLRVRKNLGWWVEEGDKVETREGSQGEGH